MPCACGVKQCWSLPCILGLPEGFRSFVDVIISDDLAVCTQFGLHAAGQLDPAKLNLSTLKLEAEWEL